MRSIIQLLLILSILQSQIWATDSNWNDEEKHLEKSSCCFGFLTQFLYQNSQKVTDAEQKLHKLFDASSSVKFSKSDQFYDFGEMTNESMTFIDQNIITFTTEKTTLWTNNLRECCGFAIHRKNSGPNGLLGHLFPTPYEVAKNLISSKIEVTKSSNNIDYKQGAEAVVVGSIMSEHLFNIITILKDLNINITQVFYYPNYTEMTFGRWIPKIMMTYVYLNCWREYKIYQDTNIFIEDKSGRRLYIQNKPINSYDPLILSPSTFPRSLYLNTKTGAVGTTLPGAKLIPQPPFQSLISSESGYHPVLGRMKISNFYSEGKVYLYEQILIRDYRLKHGVEIIKGDSPSIKFDSSYATKEVHEGSTLSVSGMEEDYIFYTRRICDCVGFSMHRKNAGKNAILGHLFYKNYIETKEAIQNALTVQQRYYGLDFKHPDTEATVVTSYLSDHFFNVCDVLLELKIPLKRIYYYPAVMEYKPAKTWSEKQTWFDVFIKGLPKREYTYWYCPKDNEVNIGHHNWFKKKLDGSRGEKYNFPRSLAVNTMTGEVTTTGF